MTSDECKRMARALWWARPPLVASERVAFLAWEASVDAVAQTCRALCPESHVVGFKQRAGWSAELSRVMRGGVW